MSKRNEKSLRCVALVFDFLNTFLGLINRLHLDSVTNMALSFFVDYILPFYSLFSFILQPASACSNFRNQSNYVIFTVLISALR